MSPPSGPAVTLGGMVVAALESRRAAELARLIKKHGGVPWVSPSMREAPLEDNRPAVEFAYRLITGQVDAMILLTGVGVERFVGQVERHVGRERLLGALSDIPTLARGPKPVAALARMGLKPTLRAPEPNTWREVLETLDRELPVANMTVGVQEYGATNPSLIAGLEARGAAVERLCVYRWAMPDDAAPLEANVRRLAAGEADVLLLTSAQQIDHMLAVAARLGLEGVVRRRLRAVVVASVGPTTSERLRAAGLPVDLEAAPPKMGTLVRLAAERAPELKRRKATVAKIIAPAPGIDLVTADSSLRGSPFLRACRGEPTGFTPVWLMRQAGRYMPEYREVRSRVSFLDLCKNPALCSEVMCTAVEYLGVDAAIIFSDLLPLLEPMGMQLEFSPGDGPVIHNPVRDSHDVDRVIDLENLDTLGFVIETVRRTRSDLPASIPLIGFAGAPFTLASYAIEGGGSRNYLHTKTLMHRDEGAWRTLMQRLARAVALYLNAQIAAGAQAVQLFDSWVGCLDPHDYCRFVQPYVRELIAGLTPGVPVIHFGAGNPALLPHVAAAGGDVVGVDWRIGLADAWRAVGHDRAVQGNLDPATLLAPAEAIRHRVADVLAAAEGRPGHVFNLGHGVVPQTPPENARAMVDMVHELSAR